MVLFRLALRAETAALPQSEKGRPEAAFPYEDGGFRSGHQTRMSFRPAEGDKAEACEANEQHRPGRGLGYCTAPAPAPAPCRNGGIKNSAAVGGRLKPRS